MTLFQKIVEYGGKVSVDVKNRIIRLDGVEVDTSNKDNLLPYTIKDPYLVLDEFYDYFYNSVGNCKSLYKTKPALEMSEFEFIKANDKVNATRAFETYLVLGAIKGIFYWNDNTYFKRRITPNGNTFIVFKELIERR